MSMNRRQVLGGTAAALASAWLPLSIADQSVGLSALDSSQLIYLTPFKSDGAESACKGEVWFVHHEREIFVVTQSDAWRAEALRKGMNRAGIWVGEFGVWKRAKESYRSAPYLQIAGRLEADAGVHKTVLEKFGAKYAEEWGSWGPRFRNGLADGSRVLLRYEIES